MVEPVSAYNTLQALAGRSLSCAQQLPAQVDAVSQWDGVGFSLLGLHSATNPFMPVHSAHSPLPRKSRLVR